MNHKGFTLIEMIVALSVVCMVSPMLVNIAQMMIKIPYDNHKVSDDIAIHQLRKIYAEGADYESDDNLFYFTYRDKDATLMLDKNRLVKTPGYEIFMHDVERLRFFEEDDCQYMEWKHRDETTKEALLGC